MQILQTSKCFSSFKLARAFCYSCEPTFLSIPVSLTTPLSLTISGLYCTLHSACFSSLPAHLLSNPLLFLYVHAILITQIPPAMGGFNPNPSMFNQMPGGYPSPSPGGFASPHPNQQPCGLYPQPGPGMPQGPGMGYPGGAPPGQPMPGYPGAPGMNPSMPGYPKAPSPNPSMPVYPKVPSPNPSMPGYGGGAPVAPAISVRT